MNRENPAEELIRMKQHDLEVRQRLLDAGKLQEGYAPEMEAVHLRHSRRLEEILAETGYPSIRKVGREASEAAWFLIQHSISRPDFMRRMLALLRSLPPEEIDAKQTACLEDRIRMYEGKKQLYGTQFDWDEEGRLSPVPCDDLRRVAERREKLGFPPLEQQIDRMRREQTFFPDRQWLRRHHARALAWLEKTGWRTRPASLPEEESSFPDFPPAPGKISGKETGKIKKGIAKTEKTGYTS